MFTPQFWETLIQLITQGEPVSPGVTNRPIIQLDQNVRYLWDILQAHSIGSALFARAVTVDASTVVGTPVSYDPVNQKFVPALALTAVDSDDGRLVLADQARVWGLVYKKHNATLADLLLCGYATLDLTGVVNLLRPGIYYLSHVQPGKLTTQNFPLNIPVLLSDGDKKVFVFPQLLDTLNHHQHYRFSLTCLPAGNHTPPAPGNPHVITSPNPNLPGWLPANHPIFGGNAPTGAKFGYNLSQHPALQQQWPPPLPNVYLEWNHPDSSIGFTGVPLDQYGLCKIDQHGIWWMTDCYNQVPWPKDYDTSSPPPPPSGPCYTSIMRMNLWFSKINYSSDPYLVKSLTSADPRLIVRCRGTNNPCSTGNLELDLDLNFVVNNNQHGYLVFKDFNQTNNEFTRGPVVEGLYSLSNALRITSTTSETRTVNSVNRQVHYGLIGLSFNIDLKSETEVQLVRLDSVEEQYYQNVTYLSFPKNKHSEIRCKLFVPIDLDVSSLGSGTQLKLYFRLLLLARSAGTLPNLSITARRIPYPSTNLSPLALPGPSSEFSVPIVTSVTTTAPNQYFSADSDSFNVSNGDTIFFSIKRSPDSYNDEVGIFRIIGKLIVV